MNHHSSRPSSVSTLTLLGEKKLFEQHIGWHARFEFSIGFVHRQFDGEHRGFTPGGGLDIPGGEFCLTGDVDYGTAEYFTRE